MKELDCVEVVNERERYVKYGVHKGMQGWICDPRKIDGTWLINFPQYGEKDDIATISMREDDLRQLPNGMDARVNEEIKARFEAAEAADNLSDYMI